LAVKSGILAAQAIVEAKKKGDYSANTLALYRQALDASFVVKDLAKYKGLSHFMESNHQLFTVYPNLVNDAATEMFTVDGVPKREKQGRILKMVKQRRGLVGAALDAIKGGLNVR
ncbi:MAG: FAD-dependent oxidoreductase, partial [Candidatus Firestonebacteria bacterium]|nr:FAD-dependent oxidoreductase [Candidatus Firestonebacteria bacterium]